MDEDPLYYMRMIVDGAMIPLLSSFGILGNIVSIVMLRSPKLDMKVSFRSDHSFIVSIE
jgi:hypothetical protein